MHTPQSRDICFATQIKPANLGEQIFIWHSCCLLLRNWLSVLFFFGFLLKAGRGQVFTFLILSLPLQGSIILPISQVVKQLYSFPSCCWFSLHSSFKNFLQKFVVSKHMTYPFTFPLSYQIQHILAFIYFLQDILVCHFIRPAYLFPFFAKATFLDCQLLTVIFTAVYHFNRRQVHSNKYLVLSYGVFDCPYSLKLWSLQVSVTITYLYIIPYSYCFCPFSFSHL